MANRVVCPHCGEKLVLRRPTIDSSKIKCGQCKGTFYSGIAPESHTVQQTDSAGQPVVQPLLNERAQNQPIPRVAKPGSSTYEVAQPAALPGWLAPVGFSTLAVMVFSGLMLGQKPPPLGETAKIDAQPSPVVQTIAAKNPAPTAASTPTRSRAELPRPESLNGTWDLQETGGGTIELSTDGSVRVAAPLLNGSPMSFSTKWFLVDRDGDCFELEFGPEALQSSNHQIRVVVSDGGAKMRLIKYSTTAGLSARERTFIKRK